jgi:ParB-like chromosome segregation protein Spo0J
MSTSQPRSKKAAPAAPAAPSFPDPVTMSLDAILPYWRNPRRINDEAVNAVVTSITEYGYSQPIVVDEGNVIIIGHTRYTALRRMGVKEAPVVVAAGLTAGQVKELRVLDNRSGEFTSWDFEHLSAELEGLNLSLMRAFFPEVSSIRDEGPDSSLAEDQGPDTSAWDEVDRTAEFICPTCFHTWEMEVTKEAVMAGKLEVQTA